MNYANTKIVTPKATLDPTPEVLAELYWSLSIEGRHKFFARASSSCARCRQPNKRRRNDEFYYWFYYRSCHRISCRRADRRNQEDRGMNETTEGKTIPEALRMIARWIEEGKEVEFFAFGNWQRSAYYGQKLQEIYRAKPGKPRIGMVKAIYEKGGGWAMTQLYLIRQERL